MGTWEKNNIQLDRELRIAEVCKEESWGAGEATAETPGSKKAQMGK